MRSIKAIACLFAFAGGAFAAGTCTLSQPASAGPQPGGGAPLWTLSLACVGDASTGSIPAVLMGPAIGYYPQLTGATIYQVQITPGSPSPTAGYAFRIINSNSVDELAGAAASLSATAAASFSTTAATPINGAESLQFSGNSVASAKTTAVLYISIAPQSVPGACATATSTITGCVKPDNSSIIISGGVISAPISGTATGVNYTAPFANSAVQTQAAVNQNVVSVTNFGAVFAATSGAAVDYTTKLQNAINSGQSLTFPQGCVVISAPLVFSQITGGSYIGQGGSTTDCSSGTTFIWKGPASCADSLGTHSCPAMLLASVNQTQFANFRISASASFPLNVGIELISNGGVTAGHRAFENIFMDGSVTYLSKGFQWDASGSSGNANNDHDVVINSRVANYSIAAVSIEMSQSVQHTFVNLNYTPNSAGSAQYGIATALGSGGVGGSFACYGCSGDFTSVSDFYIGQPSGWPITINHFQSENSNRLLTATGPNNNQQNIVLRDIRFDTTSLNGDGYAIVYTGNGPFEMDDVHFNGTSIGNIQLNPGTYPISASITNSSWFATGSCTTFPVYSFNGSAPSTIVGVMNFKNNTCSDGSGHPNTYTDTSYPAVAFTSVNITNTGNSVVSALFMQNTIAAISSLNQLAPPMEFDSQYWNGTATATDIWKFYPNLTPNPGTNPNSTMTLTHASGTSGTVSLNLPQRTYIGNNSFTDSVLTTGQTQFHGYQSIGTKFTTSGCSVSSTTGGATAGTFTVGANTCTVTITMNGATGLASNNGWACSAADITAPTAFISQNGGSGSNATFSIPVTAGTTDVIRFFCMGY